MTSDDAEPAGARFGHLLVPIDLTATSDRVLGRVALLPLSRRARIELLHVVPDNLPPRSRRRAERDAVRSLADEASNLARSLPADATVVPVVTTGAAAAEIAARSAEARTEIIVMGRVGGRPLRDSFLGSTAERVIRRSQLPVLAVRLPPRAPYGRPAIALALDEAAGSALAQLFKLLRKPRSLVTVIHAYDAPFRGLIYPSLSEEGAAEYLDRYRREATRKVEKLLDDAVARAKVQPMDAPVWRTYVQCDPPRLVIEKTVKKAEADLLVLGTRGLSGLAYAFMGTIAGESLRSVSCDVLVVPPSRKR
jgi:nucleotide-binding universal stress UspA family protein